MPLQLHQQLKNRLTELLANAIPATMVEYGMFIKQGPLELFYAEKALPKTGEFHDLLVTYIDEFPITAFVQDTLRRELRQLNKYRDDSTSVSLTTIEGYGEANAVAARMVAL